MHARLDDRQLIARHRDGDRRALDVLIERYLPLARTLALRYRHSPEPFDDLMQVASLGLVKAAGRWEPERGLAFSTFAVPTILGELRRHFRDRTWAVRPPRARLELAVALQGTRALLRAELVREPAPEDFAARLGRPRAEIAEALLAWEGRVASSLDAPLERDALALEGAMAVPEYAYAEAEAAATFDRLIAILDPRAREVLRLRFRDGLHQHEIAGRVGTSQMQVSRIIRASLETLADRVRSTAFGYQVADAA